MESKCQTGLINARSGIKTELLSQISPHGQLASSCHAASLSIVLLSYTSSESTSDINISPLFFFNPSGTNKDFKLSDLHRLKGPSHFKLDMYGRLNSLSLCLDAARSSFHKICLFNPIISQKDISASALTHHECNCSSQNSLSAPLTTSSCSSNTIGSVMTFGLSTA